MYWFLPLLLWLFQLIFTLNSLTQIRYEEVANSVRNPYWLSQRNVYGGASSNVGGEGALAIIYSVFGFSLFALAALLKKYLGEKLAIIPLIVIGLSPTMLFFNTLASHYTLDISPEQAISL